MNHRSAPQLMRDLGEGFWAPLGDGRAMWVRYSTQHPVTITHWWHPPTCTGDGCDCYPAPAATAAERTPALR